LRKLLAAPKSAKLKCESDKSFFEQVFFAEGADYNARAGSLSRKILGNSKILPLSRGFGKFFKVF
jgi:hypothetical protein